MGRCRMAVGWMLLLGLAAGCSSLGTSVRKVQSEDPNVRCEGLEVIGRSRIAAKHPEVTKVLCLAAMSDPEPQVRAAACRALATAEGDGVIEALAHVLRQDGDPFVRVDAVTALGGHEADVAVPPIHTALDEDPSIDVRIAAAETLRGYKDRPAADALAEGVGQKNIAVAQNCWESLRYMTGQDLPRESHPWTVWLASAEKPFSRYGHPPPIPKGRNQRPFVVRSPINAFKGLFQKKPPEKPDEK